MQNVYFREYRFRHLTDLFLASLTLNEIAQAESSREMGEKGRKKSISLIVP
jgi:hypothetical protein